MSSSHETMTTLPPPSNNQPYCTVSALEGGELSSPLSRIVADAAPDEIVLMPVISFLVTHSTSPTTFLFDLGVRKDMENYPADIAESIAALWNAQVRQDVPESLQKGGLNPSDIDIVCISHCHWDHVGDTKLYTKARFITGAGSATLFQPGYPADPKSHFDAHLLPPDRTEYQHAEEWGPLGPFPHAHDFYGDGSLYIVDAPGHIPGHINVLARTSPDGGWIYLAGDTAHHWSLLTGGGEIAGLSGGSCFHANKEEAAAHIRRVQDLNAISRVRVLLAHDEPWYKENKDGSAFWPGNIISL